MSTGLRNLIAIICFVIVLFWAMANAKADGRNASPRQSVCRVFKARCSPAWRVVMCESRGNPRAVSRTNDVGLFQINYAAHHRAGESFTSFKARFFDVNRNVAFAYRLSRGGTDWHHWACRWAA